MMVLDDGKHVGDIRDAAYGYMLELNGCYYSQDGRIRINSGGTMVLGFKRLKDAKAKAEQVLAVVILKPYK